MKRKTRAKLISFVTKVVERSDIDISVGADRDRIPPKESIEQFVGHCYLEATVDAIRTEDTAPRLTVKRAQFINGVIGMYAECVSSELHAAMQDALETDWQGWTEGKKTIRLVRHRRPDGGICVATELTELDLQEFEDDTEKQSNAGLTTH